MIRKKHAPDLVPGKRMRLLDGGELLLYLTN
jgi:hypothetical protein